MKRETIIAGMSGAAAAIFLAFLIVLGSRNLEYFDAALVAYTFATLFATFGIVYRYVMWLQRPPTWLYFKRGWQTFLRRGFLLRNLVVWLQRLVSSFALNAFIWRRGKARWGAHWLIMWGCIIAAAITFPLVFGWLHFETPPNDFEHYRVFVFGFPTITIAVHSLFAMFIFHGLVWSSLLVIPGVMLAMRRRMRSHDAATLQRFGEDILPLLLLYSIAITGLLLWADYTWMHGYGYGFLAILHAITVIFTLLWLPFGKFFHIFQRPAQLGVEFYKDTGAASTQAICRRCSKPFASQMHVDDLIVVERQLGYHYELPDNPAGHYQRICPQCRRAALALAQARIYQATDPWSDFLRKESAHGQNSRAG